MCSELANSESVSGLPLSDPFPKLFIKEQLIIRDCKFGFYTGGLSSCTCRGSLPVLLLFKIILVVQRLRNHSRVKSQKSGKAQHLFLTDSVH